MQVSGKFIQEGTFIENVEFKSISSVISTVIKLNKEILVPDNYDNVSIIISTSFDLIEYQQILDKLKNSQNNYNFDLKF